MCVLGDGESGSTTDLMQAKSVSFFISKVKLLFSHAKKEVVFCLFCFLVILPTNCRQLLKFQWINCASNSANM